MRAMRRTLVLGLITTGAAVLIALTPSLVQAFPENGGSETSNGSAPADGAELTHTDQLPSKADRGSIAAQPLSGDDLASFHQLIAAVVDAFPNTQKLSQKGQATLGCVLISYLNIASQPEDHVFTFNDVNLQAALLDTCLQLARSLPAQSPDRAHVAGSRCGRVDAAVTVRITHSHSGYRVTTVGPSGRISRPGLTIGCQHSRKGLLISVKPRKRGQTLLKAGARELGIAYENPSKNTVGIRTTFMAN